MNELFVPDELLLEDETAVLNVDFIQLLFEVFPMAYKSYKVNKEYLRKEADGKLLNDNIQYVLQANVFVNMINGCLKQLDESIIFIRDSYNRDFCDRRNISYVDFVEYHTDMFNSNVCTIRDLSHKLILHVFGKGVNDYKWKTVDKCLKDNNMTEMLSLYSEGYSLFSYISKKRNVSEHDGISNVAELVDLALIESTRLHSKMNTNLDHNLIERQSVNLRLLKGKDHLEKLVSLRNSILHFLCRYYHQLYQPFYDNLTNQEEPRMNNV